MTTLTPLKMDVDPLSGAALDGLREQEERLRTAVVETLRAHVFDNSGYMGSVRSVDPTARQIIAAFLHDLGAATHQDLVDHVMELVSKGMGPETALDLVDTLHQTALDILQEEMAPEADKPHYVQTLDFYRRHFLYLFMEGRYLRAMRDHERLHQGLSRSLNQQIQQERVLRDELERERRLLSSIIDNIPHPVFYKDTDGAYRGFNQAFLNFLGAEPDDLLGKTVYDLNTDQELADKYHQMDQELFDHPEQEQVYEAQVAYADGSRHDVIFNKSVFYDHRGEMRGLVGTMVDITERKDVEESLRQNEARLRIATRLANLYSWEFDFATGEFTFGDDYLELLGITPQDESDYRIAAETYAQEYMPPDLAEEVGGEVAAAVATDDPDYSRVFESSIIVEDGQVIPLRIRFNVVKDEEGNTVKLIGANQDIREEKRAEAALAKQAEELQTVAEVATTTATTLDETELLQRVVDLSKQRFGLYHAHIYLLDESEENLVLQAGAGDVGRQMVAQGRAIPLAQEQSLVARAARTRQGVIVNDVQADPGFLPNPLLPHTRAEMAVPMIVGDDLLGVLDVQADEVGRFTGQDVQIKTTLAAQTAVALQNARQYEHTQDALEEASIFRQLVESTGQGVGFSDLSGEILYVNPALAGLMGLPDPDDAQGRRVVQAYPEEQQQWVREEMIPQVMEEGVWSGELAFVTQDGRRVPTLQSVFLIHDENGVPRYMGDSVTDISELKAAEEALRENEARLAEATNMAKLYYWEFDFAKQAFEFGPEYYELLGTTAEAEGGYWMTAPEYAQRYLHPEDAPRVGQEVEKAVASDDPNYSRQFEARNLTADGRVVPVRVRFRLTRDDDGNPLKMIGANQDITEEKAAEEALRESEARLAEAVEISKLYYWEFDLAAGEFVFTPEYYELLGTSAEAEGGYRMPVSEFSQKYVHPEDAPLVAEEMQKTVASGASSYSREFRNLTADGRIVPVLVRFRVVRDEDGNPMKIIGVNQDITEQKEAERELQRREELLSTIINSTPDWIFVKDRRHRYLLVNQGYADSIGIEPEEFVGKNDLELGFPEDIVKGNPEEGIVGFWPDDNEVMASDEMKVIDVEPAVLDGEQHYLNTIKSPLHNAEGEVVGVVGFVHDITEQKQVEQALRENEARLADAVEMTKLYYWEFDLAAGEFVFTPEYYALLGTSAEAEGGYRMSVDQFSQNYVHPEDAPLVAQEMQQTVASGASSYSREFRNLTADGRVVPVLVRFRVIRDENGNPMKIIGVNQDITEQKEAEREMQRREELLRTIINATPDWIFVTDRNHRYRMVNQAYADSVGVPAGEFIGKTALDLGFPEEVVKGDPEKGITGFWPDDNRVMEADKVEVTEEEAVVAGEERYHTVIKAPLHDETGEVMGLVGFVHDITERKKAETAIAKQAEELQTVADVSTAISTTLDQREVLQDVVDLTKARFQLYHVHIYLLDAAGENLVLAAGAGEVGSRMVQEKRRIPFDQEQSLVARAGRTRKGVIVNDVRSDPAFLPHPLLPNTRAEMAVPMVVGNDLLGVLDVQADEVDYFTARDVKVHSTLAAQTAIALQNARLFEQSEQAMQELNALTRRLTREGWESYEAGQGQELAFLYDAEQFGDAQALAHAETPPSGNGRQLIQPLTIHGQEIGQLAVEPENGEAIEDAAAATEIIAAVAEQLSAHIENLRLTEQTQMALAETEEQATRLARLNEMATALNAAEELDDVYHIAAAQVLDVIGGTRSSVALLETEKGELKVAAVSGVDTVAPLGARIALDQEAGIETAVTERRVVIDQASTVKDQVGSGLQSTIIAPLVAGHRVLGALNIGSETRNAFDQNDENLLQQVAAILVSTVENRRLLQETRQRAEQLGAINRVSQTLSQYLDREALLEAAHTEVRRALNASAFFIGLYDAEAGLVDYPLIYEKGHRSEEWGRRLNEQSNSYQVITTGEPVMRNLSQAEIDELQDGSPTLIGDDHNYEIPSSLLYVPLRAGQRVLGVLSAQSYRPNAYTENDLNLLSGIAGYLAVALENVRLFDETQQRAQQLQALSEVENALSQAVTEEDIVNALAGGLAGEEDISLFLYYIETGPDGAPQMMHPMAAWEDGDIQGRHPLLQQSLPFPAYPISQLLLDRPFDVVYVSDMLADERVDEATRQLSEQVGLQATAGMPLHSGGRWQGVLVFSWPEAHSFSEKERFLLESLLEPVSAVVASRRALLAQEEALDETATLYEASAALNSARSYEEILGVLRKHTIVGDEAHNVSLNYFDRPWKPQQMPEWSEVLARYSELEESATIPRYRLDQFPAAQEVLKPDEPTVIESVAADPRLDDNSRALYLNQFQGKSTLFAPLTIAGRWVGYVNAIYEEERSFPEGEIRRLMALAGQATVAISNRRLLEQTQKRATYLEMLAQVELELSQATTEEEILTVVTTIAEHPEKLGRASLSYISLDEYDRPDAVSLQATWADGELRSDSPLLNQTIPLADYPSSELWLSRPNEVTFISDVQQSEHVDEFSRQRAEAAGLHAMALIPLRSGGRWQGVINLFWSEPDGFGEVEQFILPQLMDSVAAVVASRRAQLAQQAARHEAETLYETSQRINESPTTSAILAAMVERTAVASLNRAAVLRFATQENGDDRHLAVTATWYSGEGQLPPSVGTRYPLSAFAAVGPVWEPEPIFIGDTTELAGQAAEFAQQFEMHSMILLPLFSGNKQVGLILMAGEQPVVFDAATRRILSSLAPQVAIALENKRLLADTEARARREQLLRQITARVRGSADIDTIMRTAVQEIGRSLGRKAFIYVSNDDELEATE